MKGQANTKFETRNPKRFLVSDFDIRISDLLDVEA